LTLPAHPAASAVVSKELDCARVAGIDCAVAVVDACLHNSGHNHYHSALVSCLAAGIGCRSIGHVHGPAGIPHLRTRLEHFRQVASIANCRSYHILRSRLGRSHLGRSHLHYRVHIHRPDRNIRSGAAAVAAIPSSLGDTVVAVGEMPGN